MLKADVWMQPQFWMLKYKKSEFIKMSFQNANIKSELYCGCAYQHNTAINTQIIMSRFL